MKNYVQRGDTVTVTAPYAVLSGGGILITGTGHIFGVAVNNQNSGDSSEVLTDGVFDLTKDTSTFNEGDYVYWNNTSQECTSTATSNTKIGVAALTTPIDFHTATGEMKPTSEILTEISEGLNKLPAGLERDAAAMDLFKEGGCRGDSVHDGAQREGASKNYKVRRP
jgi:predicted RecA/RadA family phage recombinase